MKRLLIVLTGALGDISRAFCVLPPLKEHYPDLKITWISDNRWTQLVESHPLIDEVIEFDRRQSLRGLYKVYLQLKNQRYDFVWDMQRIFKSALIARSAQSSASVGFHWRDSKEGNFLFHSKKIERFGNEKSKVLHYLKFLPTVGVSQPEQISFGLHSKTFVDNLPVFPWDAQPNLALLLGSSWETKNWDLEEEIRFVQSLCDLNHYKVHLLGDRSQIDNAQKLVDRIHNEQVVNWTGKTSLLELSAILGKVRVLVGPDSGPGHLAAAMGTSVITVMGPTDPRRVAPWGMEDLVIRSGVKCSPCGLRQCPGLNKICMTSIKAEMVLQAVHKAENMMRLAKSS